MLIILCIIFSSISCREELSNIFRFWKDKYMIFNVIYWGIFIIISVGFMIKIVLSIKITWYNVMFLFSSIFCMFMSINGLKSLEKKLNIIYKIILSLNERIIFK